eukprot:TRINITY_DN7009_c0_g5_i1.p1 TRINITY_DN7009_c0_g5~~TRINITY_DN7009_c0_g5_i1.p1  ORF type:complete len:738 (-),score=208.69 TRINITY_DN7009_c0_g5_i1:150-2363(-)
MPGAMKYPTAPRDDSVSDTYESATQGSVVIKDPFRPLEEPHSEVTKKWVEEEVELFNKYFESHEGSSDLRDELNKKLLENANYERVGCPSRRNQRVFFSKNDGLQNQSVIYKTQYDPEDNAKMISQAQVLLDPNTLSSDGTTSIGLTSYDDLGKYLAFGVNRAASDWTTIHVLDVETGKELSDKIEYCKFTSVAWLPDASGFFYSRYPEPKTLSQEDKVDKEDTKLGSETDKLEFHKVYFHQIGNTQDKDQLVYQDLDHPNWMFGVALSDDDKYLIITVSESTKDVCQWYYAKLSYQEPKDGGLSIDLSKLEVIKLIDNFDAVYDYITNEGSLFFYRTNLDAPNSKIITIDIEAAKTEQKITRNELIPEKENVLNYACITAGDKIIVNYTIDVKEILEMYDLKGQFVRNIPLPGIGSVGSVHARKDYSEMFYSFSSFTTPGVIIRYKVPENVTSTFYQTKIGLDLSEIETRQVFYHSKDGTKIPMFITARKGVELDGNNPVWLYGYGGFNIALTPYFSMKNMFFVKHFDKAVFALANIRGGAEYGEKWHEGGIKEKKQNVFDDFIAAAEYLIENKYTNPKLLTIEGGSNGGLLVSATMLQRPDLFGCVISQVGVLDMLRYHRFTIGWAWKSDYGCSEEKDGFDYLIKYSPIHNVKKGLVYPSTLVLTSDHDDRVVPLHSFKFIATLQHECPENPNPLLARIETKAGHGGGVALTKAIKSNADVFAFVATELSLRYLS